MRSNPYRWVSLFVTTFLLSFGAGRAARADAPGRQVAVGANADGTLAVLYTHEDGTLWYAQQKQATALAGPTRNATFAGDVSTESPLGPGFLGANWKTPVEVYGGTVSTVALGTNADGRLEVFFIGAANQMYHAYQTSAGSPFTAAVTFFGTAKNLVVGTNPDGRMEVVWVHSTDGYVNHVYQTVPSGGWSSVSALTYSGQTTGNGALVPPVGASEEIAVERNKGPTCQPPSCGALDVFFVDDTEDSGGIAGGTVWEVLQNAGDSGGWQPPAPLVGADVVAGHIAVTHNQDGHLTLLYADYENGFDLSAASQTAPDTDDWEPWGTPIGGTALSITATLDHPTVTPGTADITQSSLYGSSGALNGKTLVMNVNGAGDTTLTFSGASSSSSETSMLAAIQAQWTTVKAVQGGSGAVSLVLTNPGHGSMIIDPSSTALGALGLTVNGGRVEAVFVDSTESLEHVAQMAANGVAVNGVTWSAATPFGWGAVSASGKADAAGCLEVFYLRPTHGQTGETDYGALYHQYQLTPGYWWSGEFPLDPSPAPAFSPVGTTQFSLILPTLPGGTNNDHTLVDVVSATNEKFGAGWYLFGILTAGGETQNAMGAAYAPLGNLLSATTFAYADYEDAPPPLNTRYACDGNCGGENLTCGSSSCSYPAAFCTAPCNGHVRWAPHVVTVTSSGATTYYMVYADGGSDLTQWSIGLRTSTDLRTWTGGVTPGCDTIGEETPCLSGRSDCEWVQPGTCIKNPSAPALSCSSLASSATCGSAAGCVWLNNACTGTGTLELFSDGIQARDPMILGGETVGAACTSGSQCTSGMCVGSVCQSIMYYDATDNDSSAGGHHVVAYRTSTDPHFATWSPRGLAYMDYHPGGDYGPTESPFVVQHGSDANGHLYYYLFIGPRAYDDPMVTGGDSFIVPNQPDDPVVGNNASPGYVGTDVFRSTSPYGPWTNAGYVGSIPAHALELVRDHASKLWYVTSAGDSQGGVWAAPLTWTCSNVDTCDQYEVCNPNNNLCQPL